MADEVTRVTSSFHADQGFTTGDPADPTPVGPLEPATEDTIGGVKQMAHIANIGAAPSQADFNGLLAALIAAGIMAAS